jgi:hypothetical protein
VSSLDNTAAIKYGTQYYQNLNGRANVLAIAKPHMANITPAISTGL